VLALAVACRLWAAHRVDTCMAFIVQTALEMSDALGLSCQSLVVLRSPWLYPVHTWCVLLPMQQITCMYAYYGCGICYMAAAS